MDQAHEHISNVGTMFSSIKKGVFPVQDTAFQALFANIMPPALLCRVDIETRNNLRFERLNDAA